jgi:hypothetical protein
LPNSLMQCGMRVKKYSLLATTSLKAHNKNRSRTV